MQKKWKRTRRGSTKAAQARAYKRYKSGTTVITRAPRSSVPAVHHYKRMLSGNFTDWPAGALSQVCSQIAGNAVYQPWRGSFSLAGIRDVINTSDFQNLYDQYRINFLVLKFYLKIDPSAQAAASATIPRLYYYRDLDDSNPPANLNEMRERANCKVYTLSLYRPLTFKIKPNVLNNVYNSTISNNYQPKWKTWLDMSNPNTEHYCGKFAIEDFRNTNMYIQVEGTVYFSCKNPR